MTPPSTHPLDEVDSSLSETVDIAPDSKPSPGQVLAAQYIPFHGDSAPTRELQREQPWHRYVLHLMARAKMSATQVAKIVQCSPATVRNLAKQQWFREKYDEIVSNRVESLYEDLMQGEDVHSLLTIIALRDDPNTPTPVRAKCAFDILDRMKGKAVQKVETSSTIVHKKETIEEMQEEMIRLEEEERSLLGTAHSGHKIYPVEARQ